MTTPQALVLCSGLFTLVPWRYERRIMTSPGDVYGRADPEDSVLFDRRLSRGRRSVSGYRGPDRRQRPIGLVHAEDRVFCLCAAVLVVGTISALAVLAFGPTLSLGSAERFVGLVEDGSAALAGMVALILFLRSRIRGQYRTAVLGVVVALLFGLHPLLVYWMGLTGWDPGLLAWLDTAAVVVAVGLVVVEQKKPPVDVRRRPLRIALAAGLSVLVLSGFFLPVFGHTDWSGPGLWAATLGHMVWPIVLIGASAVWLGALLVYRGPTRAVPMDRWVGMTLAVWGGAKLLTVLFTGAVGVVAAVSMHLLAMLALVTGAVTVLTIEMLHDRSALFEAKLAAVGHQARDRVAENALRSRSHEARSLALAVQAAASAMIDRGDVLGAAGKQALGEILRSGACQLADLIGAQPEGASVLRLSEVTRPVTMRARRAGYRLEMALPEEISVLVNLPVVHEVLWAMLEHAIVGSDRCLLQAHLQGTRVCLSFATGRDAGWDKVPTEPAIHQDGRWDTVGLPIDLMVLSGLLASDGAQLRAAAAGLDGGGLRLELPLAENGTDAVSVRQETSLGVSSGVAVVG